MSPVEFPSGLYIMNEREIHEINKYCRSSSLLVVTNSGILIRVFCPFTVEVIRKVEAFGIGDRLTVIQVKMDRNLTLVYIINNKGYYYYNFILIL
jgi:hypothetical protein